MSGPLHPRGTSNTNVRGSAASRRARKQWLLSTFGDGTYALCALQLNDVCLGVVDFTDITVDRILPGCLGGTYERHNIRPACTPCNVIDGIAWREALKQKQVTA